MFMYIDMSPPQLTWMAGEDAKHFGDITSHAITWYLELIVQPCTLLCAYSSSNIPDMGLWARLLLPGNTRG